MVIWTLYRHRILVVRLLMKVNHAIVANFDVANMSLNTIRENKIIAKISELKVRHHGRLLDNYAYAIKSNSFFSPGNKHYNNRRHTKYLTNTCNMAATVIITQLGKQQKNINVI